MKDSSLTVDKWHVGDMVAVSHFTGNLLLFRDEANQLRALLNRELADVEEMPRKEAERYMREHRELVVRYTDGWRDVPGLPVTHFASDDA